MDKAEIAGAPNTRISAIRAAGVDGLLGRFQMAFGFVWPPVKILFGVDRKKQTFATLYLTEQYKTHRNYG